MTRTLAILTVILGLAACSSDITAPQIPEQPRYATTKAATGTIVLEVYVVQVVGVPPQP